MAIYDNVYGITYNNALVSMNVMQQELAQHQYKGFETIEDLMQCAHDFHLDKIVYSQMSKAFMCVSHKGELMTSAMYEQYYGSILFCKEQHGKSVKHCLWHPSGFQYFDNAYIVGEQSDGIHKPLYYRDYFVPSGFYNEDKDAFNVAKPFPVFAKETGRDTSHIYTYIEHIAGECAYHLLAWLRAKLLYPTTKTQIVPIIVSRAQGSGKTTFAEVICKGLFGKDNVIVSDQYDSTARFNADYADALIVCQEEKELEDKRNPAGALKSRATATTIRKEQKGVDPIYQESYTDFIMTTNKDVPIKFDGREDQRRFMVMESDPNFTRKTSDLADEVFTKLYGYDANFNKVGTPFIEDKDLIAQFKHELFSREDIANVKLREFPKTAAYKKCFTIPRTSDAVEIENITRALAPFIKASLEQKKIVTDLEDLHLCDIMPCTDAIQYVPEFRGVNAFVAVCKPLAYYELGTQKPFAHSVVERGLYDCNEWLKEEYGIVVMSNMEALPGGFTKVAGRYRSAPAARFSLLGEEQDNYISHIKPMEVKTEKQDILERKGERFRVNKNFMKDENGCFETVNELKEDTKTLKNKTKTCLYMDTFLLESDTPTKQQQIIEKQRIEDHISMYGDSSEIKAEELYKERLEYALNESMRLFNDGKVARIVYSGSKSYHLLIRVKDSPTTLDEYRWLHGWLCNNLSDKLIFDESTCDPARLTRSPLTLQRVTANKGLLVLGTQKLIKENWSNVYNLNWRPIYEKWKERPLTALESTHSKQLYPTRPEYMEATSAIIDGTFWSDSKYDGERQRLFFPSYRLLRGLGYSNKNVFEELLPNGLKNYKKQNEIQYWLSRGRSALIQEIDEAIDNIDFDKEEN